MSSKPSEPPVLLLIDLQQGLVEGPAEWGPRSTPSLVDNVTYLLKTWRSKDWPILHVQHDDIDDPTNPVAAIHPTTFKQHSCSTPENNEPVFVKHTGSAFVGTGLEDAIKKIGKEKERKIVVIGMDGAQCVNSTTRHGADLGYQIVVVGDACSTYGMEDWKTGKQLGAEETHDAAMGMLTGYSKVTTTKEVLSVLGF